jgi:hypothetical protein
LIDEIASYELAFQRNRILADIDHFDFCARCHHGADADPHRRELDLLGYRFTGPMATAALLGLFLAAAVMLLHQFCFCDFNTFSETDAVAAIG